MECSTEFAARSIPVRYTQVIFPSLPPSPKKICIPKKDGYQKYAPVCTSMNQCVSVYVSIYQCLPVLLRLEVLRCSVVLAFMGGQLLRAASTKFHTLIASSGRVSESGSESGSEWVSEWVRQWVRAADRHSRMFHQAKDKGKTLDRTLGIRLPPTLCV